MHRMAWGVRQERMSVTAASDPVARNVAREMGVPYSPATSMAANGLELVYDMFGDAHAPPLLLIAGLASPMIAWDERFCARLALRGYRVIRFDNRDTGLSSYCPRFGIPDIRDLYAAKDKGIPVAVPYTLGDMALAAEAAERAHGEHSRGRSVFGIVYADLILALVEKARGRLGAAQALLERARHLARETQGSPSYSEALVAVFLGELAYERGGKPAQ